MRITTFGTRGSYPVCRREMLRYGGNTTCFFVESGADEIVIDGGSGLVNLGHLLLQNPRTTASLSMFLTHPHWDHVVGYPHFGPFYRPDFKIDVYTADAVTKPAEQVFSTQHKGSNFPVDFQSLAASIKIFRISSRDKLQLRETTVEALQLNHPGMNLGFRFSGNGRGFALLTDLAPIWGNVMGQGMKERADGHQKQFEDEYMHHLVEFIRGTDLVIHDTNFTDEGIKGKEGWGHSTPQLALDLLAHLDTPPALVLSHHDPSHTDQMMDEIYEHAKKAGRQRRIEVLIAKENEAFDL